MTFSDFRKRMGISLEDICREIYEEHRLTIRIKKEKTLLKNLSSIMETALQISNEKGFQAMSMRDLSRESGLSMGALYAYFSGKEELLEVMLRTGRTAIHRTMGEALTSVLNPRDRLRTAIETHLFLSEVMQPWFFFSYMEAKNLSEDAKENAKESELRTEAIFGDIIREGCRAGVFIKNNGNLTAALIKAMIQDWYLKRWKYSRRGVSVDQYAGFVVEFVESFLLSEQ